MRKTIPKFLSVAFVVLFTTNALHASKLAEVKVLDQDYIHLHFYDGEVTFRDDAQGTCPHDHCEDLDNSIYTAFGSPLNTNTAQQNNSYSITSSDDADFSSGIQPTVVHRKTNMSGMNQKNWVGDDYTYDFAMEHQLYLKLPTSLENGKTYTITINGGSNSDQTSVEFTYDIYNTRSEAIKVNVVGYSKTDAIKAADVYYWMGDGDQRDYSSFEGNKIYIYNVNTKQATEVGTLSYGVDEAREQSHGHPMLQSNTWNADFTGFNTAGTYKLAIEGIGCSDEFEISDEVYRDPFGVSVQGFFYMRIGQETYANGYPVPRQPLFIPGHSDDYHDATVLITEMQPYHPEWSDMCNGCDEWDIKAGKWNDYVLPGRPTNPNAYGGHSDALDWDRYLGHVSIIYDMLLPYIASGGSQNDDDLGIAESGNGIPDLLDEAQNEVDLWLRLRDGKGYAHGLNNPDGNNVFYQAGTTAVAAWANAANASMLAYAYELAGQSSLKETYLDSAEVAYNYASNLADQQLDKTQGVGMNDMSGLDFKNTAAAFLYNLTGNTDYESQVVNNMGITNGTSQVTLSNIYAAAGYLLSPQVIHFQSFYDNLKASTIHQAKIKEANYSLTRPSRRASDNAIAWMQTEIGVHRCIVAHAILDDGADKQLIENALILEADYSLGRNPMNRILMTTATTPLENERSCEEAFTSGWDDGSPGVHPGHTPYLNPYSWGGDRYMGNPEKMAALSYPAVWTGGTNSAGMNWPMGEVYYNTRFVYAHTEFTPQQTMRGKTALYAYLYSISTACDKPNLGADVSICGMDDVTIDAGIDPSGKTISWEGPNGAISGGANGTITVDEAGDYIVTVNDNGCIKSDRITVKGTIPSIYLGDHIDLCNVTSVTLDATISGTGYSYAWEKDGVAIEDANEQTYDATMAGTYAVTVSVSGCPDASDDIEITSSLIPVSHDTICGEGQVTLQILGNGSYSWHAGADTDDFITDELSYSPTLSQTTTYYIEEIGSVTGNVGPTGPGTNTWGNWENSYADGMAFTVLQPLTIKSVKVSVRSSGVVQVNLNDGTGQTISQSVNVTGLNTIDLNFEITTPGEYVLDLIGTTASLDMDNETGDYISYPYELPNVLSIDYVAWEWGENMERYMFLYDWEVEYSGSACARTPVTGVINDPLSAVCTTTNTAMNQSNALIELYPNPTSGVITFSTNTPYVLRTIVGHELQADHALQIDLSPYPDGTYLIEIEGVVYSVIKE